MRTNRKPIIIATWLLAIPALSLVLSGCVQNQQRPIVRFSPAQIDRACIIEAGSELRRIMRLEATEGRALPPPPQLTSPNPETYRTVELDTTSVGMKVTYMFLCSVGNSGQAFTEPMGHR